MIAARALQGRRVHPRVSLEINPGSRQVLENLILAGGLVPLLAAGARVMPPGCWGCIGMGQAPPTNAASVRTFPRNFPGRSGTKDDRVYLASPETVARPFRGNQDPGNWGLSPVALGISGQRPTSRPAAPERPERRSGANIVPSPSPACRSLVRRGLAPGGDNVTTDDILPAGSQILPLRAISRPSAVCLHPAGPDFSASGPGEGVIGGEN
jgi:aconitate hydratase